jgi:heptaprenyl diphosphate synthase
MTGLERFRQARRDLYQRLFSSRALFITGLCIMPALLFNPNPLFRVLQFLFFWFLAWFTGKKNNPLITIAIILSIVFFNLLVPYGRVLFAAGVFKITAGALVMGIQRAVTLEGLIMLSRVSIRRDLRLPGGFGELIGESFRIFALIMDSRQRITRKNLIGDIDALMLELSGDAPAASGTREESPANGGSPGSADTEGVAAGNAGGTPLRLSTGPVPEKRTTVAGYIVLAAVVILSWLPMIFMFVLSVKAMSAAG